MRRPVRKDLRVNDQRPRRLTAIIDRECQTGDDADLWLIMAPMTYGGVFFRFARFSHRYFMASGPSWTTSFVVPAGIPGNLRRC